MNPTRLTALQLERLLNAGRPLSLLDARDPQSHARSHLAGAVLLNRDSLDTLLTTLPRATPVVIYCYHGNASQTYAAMFADFRFEQVHDLIGGWAAWEQHLAQGVDRTTPLMKAARQGDVQTVRALLAAGADVRATNADGNTALWLACFSDSMDTLDALIDAGAPIDHQNDNGATCLMFAASAGKTEVVRRLLRAGADITLQSLDDYTALDMASTMECLRLLREAERRALASRPGAL